MYTIVLGKGKEKMPMKHHPWIFTGAMEKVQPKFEKAGWAQVLTHDMQFIAWGWYDPLSHIVLHLLSWNRDEDLETFIYRKTCESVERRCDFISGMMDTDSYRLIHGEADFIPGVAADRYGDMIKIVVSSRFANDNIDTIVKGLYDSTECSLIVVNADPSYASSERISEKPVIYVDGKIGKIGEDRLESRVINESGILYEVSPRRGQKSGFYCDQRENRKIAERYAKDRVCLDLCCYTGAFTLHLLRAGAKSVKSVDASETVLRHLLYQIHLNENSGVLPEGSRAKVEIESADCFEYMRGEEEGKYDLIILDPPKLAKTKGQLEKALKAYKDLNRVAMTKIRNNGIIITFSCSGALTREDFRMMLSWSAKDAGVEAQILETLSQGCDHPVRMSFPESEYLKGYVVRIIR